VGPSSVLRFRPAAVPLLLLVSPLTRSWCLGSASTAAASVGSASSSSSSPAETQDESPSDSVERGFSETPVSIASAVLEGGSGICRLVDSSGWLEVPATIQALARFFSLRRRVFADGPWGTVGGGPPTHGVAPLVGCATINGPETVVSPVTVRSKGPGDSL